MNGLIKEKVKSCIVCEKFTRNVQKEPVIQEKAKYPYHIVGMHVFEYAGRYFVSVYDSYSNYLVATELKNKTASQIIESLNALFFKIGYPTVIRCDNSPFNSQLFEQFALQNNIKFQFSSPHYPQSNGLAEKGVAIAKNILKRLYEAYDVQSYQYRILECTTTPVGSMNLSHAELFFGRRLKTRISVLDSLLFRNSLDEDQVRNKIDKKKEKQAYYFNLLAKKQPK